MKKSSPLRLARADAVRQLVANRGGRIATLALYQSCKWNLKATTAQVNLAIDDLARDGEVSLIATGWEIVVVAKTKARVA